jgi:riboflavin biosynthesis pyrimidine reductase
MKTLDSPLPYRDLTFPPAPSDRPFVYINMVSTIDGKILTGHRDEPVMDLGSAVDHRVMRHLESIADAIMLGAGSLRATPGLHYPAGPLRIVVSASGRLPFERPFFVQSPSETFVATDAHVSLPEGVRRLPGDLRACLASLRRDFGVRRLLCEGGSELNASLLALDLVDELFLTLAPKVKLGRDVPTYADGEPLSRANVQAYSLVECHRIEDEVFLRYRRRP